MFPRVTSTWLTRVTQRCVCTLQRPCHCAIFYCKADTSKCQFKLRVLVQSAMNHWVGRAVCVGRCVCVCVYPFCVNVRCLAAKIMKNHLYGIDQLQSNEATPGFLLLYIDVHFKITFLAFWLFCEYLVNGERWSKHFYCHQIGRHAFTIKWHQPLRMLYIMILTYIFEVKLFNWIFWHGLKIQTIAIAIR